MPPRNRSTGSIGLIRARDLSSSDNPGPLEPVCATASAPSGIDGAVGATTITNLWSVCGGVPAMGEQTKFFYRSDRGVRW
jgi:hypothetical protein